MLVAATNAVTPSIAAVARSAVHVLKGVLLSGSWR
jgi:hypothetical protein